MSENKALPAAPARRTPALARKLTTNQMKVLHLVRAGDPYRDKAPGKAGRTARLRTLDQLRRWDLVRNDAGLLKPTFQGLSLLLAQATTPKR